MTAVEAFVEANGGKFFFTTAEESYDWFGTEGQPTSYVDNRGKPFRLVIIMRDRVESQLARYGSGLHQAYTPEQMEAELAYGHYVKKAEVPE